MRPSDLTRTAALFHALSDERRLLVVRLLAAGERCVCELTDAVGVAQPLLSFHLKELKKAGLVADRRQGRWAYYSLVPEAFEECEALWAALIAPYPAPPCCGPLEGARTDA